MHAKAKTKKERPMSGIGLLRAVDNHDDDALILMFSRLYFTKIEKWITKEFYCQGNMVFRAYPLVCVCEFL